MHFEKVGWSHGLRIGLRCNVFSDSFSDSCVTLRKLCDLSDCVCSPHWVGDKHCIPQQLGISLINVFLQTLKQRDNINPANAHQAV